MKWKMGIVDKIMLLPNNTSEEKIVVRTMLLSYLALSYLRDNRIEDYNGIVNDMMKYLKDNYTIEEKENDPKNNN